MEAEDKLLKAFELFRPHISGHKTAMELFFDGIKQIEIDKEAYHKAKVEAISDKVSNEIKELESALEVNDLSEYGGGRLDAFKEVNELLKQYNNE